jgi:hypothetical protein
VYKLPEKSVHRAVRIRKKHDGLKTVRQQRLNGSARGTNIHHDEDEIFVSMTRNYILI